MLRHMMSLTALVTLLTTAGQAYARCGGCADPCLYGGTCGTTVVAVPCEPRYVEKTVLVPTWVTETRKVMVTEYEHQTRERTVTVHKLVPETREVTREYTVMVPTTHTKTVTYTVCVPVTTEVTKDVTVRVPVVKEVTKDVTVKVPVTRQEERQVQVLVPQQEVRQGVRKVCKVVPVTEKRVVTRDRGHWGEQLVEVPCGNHCYNRRHGKCGGCGGCNAACPSVVQVLRKCWVPNIVQEEVEVTCHKRVVEDQPYEYTVTVCKPETQTRTVTVCDYEEQTKTLTQKICTYEDQVQTRTYKVCELQKQERTKDVTYVVCEPEKRTKTETVTYCKKVPVEQTQTYTVCVPRQVEKEVQVKVCKLVEKTVLVPAGGHCGYGCGHRAHRRRGC